MVMEMLSKMSEWGIYWGGIAFFSLLMCGVLFFAIMIVFLVFKAVFFPKQRKSESLQYMALKQFAYPFLASLFNDITKAAVTEKEDDSTSK
jgi:hypothetical protein